MHQQVFQRIQNILIVYLLLKLVNKYFPKLIEIVVVEILVILKKVLQQQQDLYQNHHYINHVHIVIVNNVHHLIIIKNLLKILQLIHQRQIQLSIHHNFIMKFFKKNKLYQQVDLIHILNHYQKQQYNNNKNDQEQLQLNDDEIYLVIVHFGEEHKHNNL